MGDGGGSMDKWLSMIPADTDKIIGSAVAFFVRNQNPNGVEFSAHPNGYKITVYADTEDVKEAHEFWTEHVEPELSGE